MNKTDFTDQDRTFTDGDIGDTEGQYLTFFSDQQLFGIPIADVVQIVGMQKITEIPEYPAYAKGIINLRSLVIPVIDIRIRLGRPEMGYNDRTCIIVANIQESYFGFIVDEVDEVTHIDPSAISQPPKVSEDTVNRYLTGIAKLEEKIVLLIDPAKILRDEEYAALSQPA